MSSSAKALSRRQALAAGVSSLLLAGLPRARAQGAATQAGPRYFVTLFLRGGIDAIYTTDPKTRADVEARVDVPYGANAIASAGNVALGPHFAPLTKWAPQMSVLRAVQVKTANHESGAYQVLRMRTDVTPHMPSIYDVIGMTRDSQPLGSVLLGDLAASNHSPGALEASTGNKNPSPLEAIDGLDDEDLALLAKAYRGHEKDISSWVVSPEATRTREYVGQAASFFEQVGRVPRFRGDDTWTRSKKGKPAQAAEDLQRTLWLLENDLARGVCVKIFFDWDSHFRNADKQTQANADFVSLLDQFLSGLAAKKNAHGSLASQTAVVVTSELGRFPIINGDLGKDHWPEAPMMFFGPHFAGGKTWVPTGKMMEGLPVSPTTGAPGKAGAVNLLLDDVGTTLVHMAGMNPTLFGYNGKRLRFLERA